MPRKTAVRLGGQGDRAKRLAGGIWGAACHLRFCRERRFSQLTVRHLSFDAMKPDAACSKLADRLLAGAVSTQVEISLKRTKI